MEKGEKKNQSEHNMNLYQARTDWFWSAHN